MNMINAVITIRAAIVCGFIAYSMPPKAKERQPF